MAQFLQFVMSGVAVGSIYGLVALGIVLVYKSTHVFNFAHGEMVALSAYVLTTFTALLGNSGVVPILATLVASACMGLLMHVLIVRHMMGKPLLATVMATIGVGLAIRALILIVYGPDARRFESPMPQDILVIGGVRIAAADLVTVAIAGALLGLFALFFTRSRLGLEMRAVASHMEASILSGVHASFIFGLALGVGALLAGVSGILLASSTVVSVHLSSLALIAFPAVIIGGITSVSGAVIGGVLVGILEKLAAGYIGPQAAIAIVYTVLLVVLLVRPHGIFGAKEVVRA